MAGRRTAGWTAVACVLFLVAGCAQRAGGTASSTDPPTHPPEIPADQLVLQIRHVGGFLPLGQNAAALPVLSIYADGRVVDQGPVDSRYPAPALPNVRVRRISPADVRMLVERALAAGVRDTADLGRPGVMDAATTRITVVTGSATYVRTVYALGEAAGTMRQGGGRGVPPKPVVRGVTAAQQAARAKLLDLVRALTDLPATLGAGAVHAAAPYVASSVAAVVTPYRPSPQDPPQPAKAWPGPALPGSVLPGPPGVTCVTATGQAAAAVLTAARSANQLTPWTTSDGRKWWVALRPLLPGEHGCADLTG
jgi:hypothetical protein